MEFQRSGVSIIQTTPERGQWGISTKGVLAVRCIRSRVNPSGADGLCTLMDASNSAVRCAQIARGLIKLDIPPVGGAQIHTGAARLETCRAAGGNVEVLANGHRHRAARKSQNHGENQNHSDHLFHEMFLPLV